MNTKFQPPISIEENDLLDIFEENAPKPSKFFHKTDSNPDAVKYIDNEAFSLRVAEYVKQCSEAEENGMTIPRVPDDIAISFVKIINNLARSKNFSSYTWLDEMKSDAIENCIRYVRKFNIEAKTRTGKPEAFSYFTRIVYFAFLRRIKLENAQLAIKDSLISKYNVTDELYSLQETDKGRPQDEVEAYAEKSRSYRGI
jgi:hypothetical protein